MTGMTGLTPKKKILEKNKTKNRFLVGRCQNIILMSKPVIPVITSKQFSESE